MADDTYVEPTVNPTRVVVADRDRVPTAPVRITVEGGLPPFTVEISRAGPGLVRVTDALGLEANCEIVAQVDE